MDWGTVWWDGSERAKGSLKEPESMIWFLHCFTMGFPGGWDGEKSARPAGDSGSIPGLRGSPREGNGNLLQCSCLPGEFHGTWRIPWKEEAGGLQSMGLQIRTQLNDFHFLFTFVYLSGFNQITCLKLVGFCCCFLAFITELLRMIQWENGKENALENKKWNRKKKKSLFQHHSSKVSFLHCSAFFMVQLSHPYTTTGKTIALTRWAFAGKVMSLLFNTLSRMVQTQSRIYSNNHYQIFPFEISFISTLFSTCFGHQQEESC